MFFPLIILHLKCFCLITSCYSPAFLHPVVHLSLPLSALWTPSSSLLWLPPSFVAEVPITTCLRTTATLSAVKWLNSWQAERSHRTSQTFHLTSSPRKLLNSVQSNWVSADTDGKILKMHNNINYIIDNKYKWKNAFEIICTLNVVLNTPLQYECTVVKN